MMVVVEDFRSLTRDTLRGFAWVRLPEGIVLHDCAVHCRDGKAWASPPRRPMFGREGTQLRDAAGKAQFSPTITFADRVDQEVFSVAILAVVAVVYPEVLR